MLAGTGKASPANEYAFAHTYASIVKAAGGTHNLTELLQSIMGFESYGDISVIGFFLRSTVMRACSFAEMRGGNMHDFGHHKKSDIYGFFSFTVCVTSAMVSGEAVMCYIFSTAVQNGM